jgi:hypothetical protein
VTFFHKCGPHKINLDRLSLLTTKQVKVAPGLCAVDKEKGNKIQIWSIMAAHQAYGILKNHGAQSRSTRANRQNGEELSTRVSV